MYFKSCEIYIYLLGLDIIFGLHVFGIPCVYFSIGNEETKGWSLET
jgi:hypothetical protein